METANWLLGETTSLFGSLLWNFLSTGFLYGLLGFAIGLGLVMMGEKWKFFTRPNKVWTIVAKLNWVYLPVLLAVCFCVFGATRSVQNSLDSWIDASSDMLQSYSAAYIPKVENIGQQLLATTNEGEHIIEAKILENMGSSFDNQLAQKFYTWINRSIMSYTAEYLGYDDTIQGFQSMIKDEKLQQLNTTAFGNTADFLQSRLANEFMLPTYWWLFLILSPFIAIPIIEGLTYMVWRWILRRRAASRQ